MSFKCIIGVHRWNGCKCSECEKTRDEQHDWSKDCEKCSKCGKTRENQHQWNNYSKCKCNNCEQTNDERHDWGSDCERCVGCGKTRENQHVWEGCKCKFCNQHKWAEGVSGYLCCSTCGRIRSGYNSKPLRGNWKCLYIEDIPNYLYNKCDIVQHKKEFKRKIIKKIINVKFIIENGHNEALIGHPLILSNLISDMFKMKAVKYNLDIKNSKIKLISCTDEYTTIEGKVKFYGTLFWLKLKYTKTEYGGHEQFYEIITINFLNDIYPFAMLCNKYDVDETLALNGTDRNKMGIITVCRF